MWIRKFFSNGLRTHALALSFGLIALTGLLGVRAYLVARGHLVESRDLVERDVPVQNLLHQIETSQVVFEQAKKKWKITADPVYSQLMARHMAVLEKSEQELRRISPELSLSDGIASLRQKLAAERELRVRHARDTAAGLLRLILVAVTLSVFLTAWLILLLFKGLMEPLEQLNQATDRIKGGNLAYRIDNSQGLVRLRELDELARSFNSMAERLEALDQAKRDFLMMISHEIKNPMAALKEGLSLLTAPEYKGRRLSPEAHKRCVSACQIASKRLEYMINNLLSLSRSETGMFKFDKTRQDFEAAVQSSVAEVRPLADKKSMQIQVSCPRSIRITFDREAMVQALVNLLLNAIKYGSENSTIEVQVTADPKHGVEVAVTNFGKVIAPSELTRVFDRFYRGQNASQQQGMGIGLHVVKKVVEAHQGFVSALSEAGRTQMIVNLPGES